MTQHFIYKPNSGDRVFIERPSDWLAITTWGNGCRTVVGDIVVLTWSTARPTRWWRDLACRALTDAINAIREGVAYDAQGIGPQVPISTTEPAPNCGPWTLAEIAALTGERTDADWVRNHVAPEPVDATA